MIPAAYCADRRQSGHASGTWLAAVDVPPPTPDVPPPSPPAAPPAPPAPDTPWPTPPEVIEPSLPGQHEPVRDPVVPKDGGEPGPVPPTVH